MTKKKKPLFTPEELAEMAAADAEIDADFQITEEEAVTSEELDVCLATSKEEQERAKRRAYRAAHREEQRAYMRAYKEAHREELRAYNRAYYAEHREERIEHTKCWQRKNKERVAATARAYYRKNREKKLEEARKRRQDPAVQEYRKRYMVQYRAKKKAEKEAAACSITDK